MKAHQDNILKKYDERQSGANRANEPWADSHDNPPHPDTGSFAASAKSKAPSSYEESFKENNGRCADEPFSPGKPTSETSSIRSYNSDASRSSTSSSQKSWDTNSTYSNQFGVPWQGKHLPYGNFKTQSSPFSREDKNKDINTHSLKEDKPFNPPPQPEKSFHSTSTSTPLSKAEEDRWDKLSDDKLDGKQLSAAEEAEFKSLNDRMPKLDENNVVF